MLPGKSAVASGALRPIGPAIDGEAMMTPVARWQDDGPNLMLQPAREDYEIVAPRGNVDPWEVLRAARLGAGPAINPKLAASETRGLSKKIIDAGDDPGSSVRQNIMVRSEETAIAVGAKLEFPSDHLAIEQPQL